MSWKIKPVDEIEVYVTKDADVAIRQNYQGLAEDSVVVVPRDHIDRVIRFLQEAAEAAKVAAAELEEVEETG